MIFQGCISGGTHGYIRAYSYPVSKYDLEKVVWRIFEIDTTIKRGEFLTYYNDGKTYITLSVFSGEEYEYRIRFNGDSTVWATSANASISICYAWEGIVGGSAGDNGFKGKPEVEKRVITVFEKTIVRKVDSILGIKHTLIE